MSFERARVLPLALLLLSAAIVFSPLIAVFTQTGLDALQRDEAFHHIGVSLRNTIGIATVSALIALLLGVPFAILVERSHPAFRRIGRVLGLIVLIVPPYIVGEAWIVLLGPAGKISRPIAMLLGFGSKTRDPIQLARYSVPGFVYSWPIVGVIMGGCLFPIVALAVGAAYRRTDHRAFESARIAQGTLGVWKIASRVLRGPAVGGALLVFAIAMTEFSVPQLLRVRVIGEAIYELIQEKEPATAAALSLPTLPLIFIAGALGLLVLARSRDASMAGLEGEIPNFDGVRAGVAEHVTTAVVTLLATAPALILPVVSLSWLTLTAQLPRASSIGAHKLLRASGFFDSLQGALALAREDAVRTVIFASIAATLAVVFTIAVVRANRNRWMLGLLGAGLAVPAPIVGLGLIVLWDRPATAAVYQSAVIVLLAWFARLLPLVVFLIQDALSRVPGELESAAALAGRKPFERIAEVVLPCAMPGLLAAWVAMYVLSATEFGATFLVLPPGQPLLAPSVVNLMRRGQDPEVAACQFLLLSVVALPLVLMALGSIVRRRKG